MLYIPTIKGQIKQKILLWWQKKNWLTRARARQAQVYYVAKMMMFVGEGKRRKESYVLVLDQGFSTDATAIWI